MQSFLQSVLIGWLEQTAWPMTPPQPYSAFHLLFAVLGTGLSALLARALARRFRDRPRARLRLLFACGLILALSEIYKQLFLFWIVNRGVYDWWYFPFQLCSLPMYLCLILPLCTQRLRRILYTFLYSYNLLGALMAFLEPSGLMHPYWTLTLHGFFWHLILIFLGLFLAFSGSADPSPRGFLGATALFFAGCGIATAVNVLSHPFGAADMFYISPYFPNTQIVFSRIADRFGIAAGNLSYLAAIVFGAFLLHLLYRRRSAGSPKEGPAA